MFNVYFGRLDASVYGRVTLFFLTGVYLLLTTVNRMRQQLGSVAAKTTFCRWSLVRELEVQPCFSPAALPLSRVDTLRGGLCDLERLFYAAVVPSRRGRKGWVFALICGVLAANARATTGLFALATFRLRRRLSYEAGASQPGGAVIPWNLAASLIGALSIAGLLTLNVISYLKFRTFESIPLRYHIAYTPDRLEATGGQLLTSTIFPTMPSRTWCHTTSSFEPLLPISSFTVRIRRIFRKAASTMSKIRSLCRFRCRI
jgi:hypothetical protein